MSKNKKPAASRNISFSIDNMDPLGQGVSKENDMITFIAKTLPEETGAAKVYKASKGVQFAKLESLEKLSPNRIAAECEHFAVCPGCHYLHTDYTHELEYKLKTLEGLLQRNGIVAKNMEVIAADQRFGYRNRIQLHYRYKYLGLLDGVTDEVVEIPQCRVIRDELKHALDALYADRSWAGEHGKEGHCELYLKPEGVSVVWNEDYSHGGFTQVNDAMNNKLCALVHGYLQLGEVNSVVDLFAGDGNLTNQLATEKPVQRVCVDYFSATPVGQSENKSTSRFSKPGNKSSDSHPDFINLDLYDVNALKQLQTKTSMKACDVMVLDPPRKGFPEIDKWVKKFSPKKMIYVSCNPATLMRDLASLSSSFKVENVVLLDLFPCTYHFETVVHVRFKQYR